MGIFSGKKIRDRLRLPINEPESMVITPLLTPDDAFDYDAVDLRLGSHFIMPQSPPEAAILPDSRSREASQLRVHVPIGDYLVVPAHQTVLGATLEFIKMPHDASGEILTKSSVARTFTVIETAPWVHPSYRGCLTLEIANVSNTPLILYPGRAIAQLVLISVDDPEVPEKLSGSYLGPVYPETPKFKDPEEDLAKLGVQQDRVRRPAFALKGS